MTMIKTSYKLFIRIGSKAHKSITSKFRYNIICKQILLRQDIFRYRGVIISPISIIIHHRTKSSIQINPTIDKKNPTPDYLLQ